MKKITKISGITASAAVVIILITAIVGFAQQQIRLTTIMPTQTQMRGISGVVGSNNGAWPWQTMPLRDDEFWVGGRLGIGTNTPQTLLDISTTGAGRPQLRIGDVGGAFDIWGGSNFHIVNANIPGDPFQRTMLFIEGGTGNVGIGPMTAGTGMPHPTAKLEVKGQIKYSVGTHTIEMTAIGGPPFIPFPFSNPPTHQRYIEYHIDGAPWGSPLWVSSKRFKDNVRELELDSSKIYDLKPVSFDWKKDYGVGKSFGLIAEDVMKVFPELVSFDKDGKPFMVRYELLSVLLLNELNKKSDEIKDINEAVKAQAKEIESMKRELNKLKK